MGVLHSFFPNSSDMRNSTTVKTSLRWGKLTVLVVVIVGMYALASQLDIESLLDPDRVAEWLRSAGPFGPILFMALMAAAVVISPIPSLPLDFAAGAAFGTLLGTSYAVIGAEIGAVASFLIGRTLGRDLLAKMLRTNVSFCEQCSDRHLAMFVLFARLIPLFSFDVISYGAGLTNMSLRVFALVTFIGMFPPTFALTYAGSQVASGTWLMILLGLVMVAMLLLIPRLVLRYPTARWVRFLRGDMPVPTPSHVSPLQPAVPGIPIPSQCDSCGEPVS